MRTETLTIDGARLVEPDVFPDDRGSFCPFLLDSELAAGGVGGLFRVRQGSTSVSRAGVLRGLHFTATPPGNAKYVTCTSGRVRDLLVDIRVGSPTFGAVDVVELDGEDTRCLLVPVGVGHAFHAVEEGTRVLYLLSTEYVPEEELSCDLYDPELGLPLPPADEVLMSDRDRAAPSLAALRESGALPVYEDCVRIDRELRVPYTADTAGAGTS